mmetsp:Transcript_49561/g.91418  ORF Transcript_49561/g.91418 Transcript_49561/m.91418 type:complete len:98 (+) Transcript_49561:573-866(+)
MDPNSEIVAFGYLGSPTHFFPNVPHVRATLEAEQVKSTPLQNFSELSLEQATYGCEVAYEIPLPVLLIFLIHWYAALGSPPLHEPALPQFSMCCTDN